LDRLLLHATAKDNWGQLSTIDFWFDLILITLRRKLRPLSSFAAQLPATGSFRNTRLAMP
jgi:hypothetical protein